ncbi:24750_t:CDS:2 [Cetraspora pellucida]|uniref:24750_t:CDS:1 n=1 Tax=Cetraspora pellucida TaxID=1433469 RepID=A0A9N9IVL7_9GLOM|nr:24750_t:CDS:2 [Cetraspora pellucida]
MDESIENLVSEKHLNVIEYDQFGELEKITKNISEMYKSKWKPFNLPVVLKIFNIDNNDFFINEIKYLHKFDIKEDTPNEFNFESNPIWKDYSIFLFSIMECSNMIKDYHKDRILVLYHENKDLFDHYLYVVKVLNHKLQNINELCNSKLEK